MSKEIQDKLLNFIFQNFSVDREDIFLEESLIDQGIIDSSGLMEIVSFIEDEYSIVIQEEHMLGENFGSTTKITNFILNETKKQTTLSKVA